MTNLDRFGKDTVGPIVFEGFHVFRENISSYTYDKGIASQISNRFSDLPVETATTFD